MKPSERRALEAERRAQKEAEAREIELTSKKKEEASNEQPITVEGAPNINTDEKPYVRKEGFFQSHIRLITFIITATLIITVFGPLGVDMLVAKKNDKIVNNKEDISIETVYKIYDLYDSVQWGSFKNFNYTDYSDKIEGTLIYEREYPVKDSRLVVKAGGSSLSDKPEYIYLIDYRDGVRIDLKKEDPRNYVKQMED